MQLTCLLNLVWIQIMLLLEYHNFFYIFHKGGKSYKVAQLLIKMSIIQFLLLAISFGQENDKNFSW